MLKFSKVFILSLAAGIIAADAAMAAPARNARGSGVAQFVGRGAGQQQMAAATAQNVAVPFMAPTPGIAAATISGFNHQMVLQPFALARPAEDTATAPVAQPVNEVVNEEEIAIARAAAEVNKTNCLANNTIGGGDFVWGSLNLRNNPDYATKGIANVGLIAEDVDPTNNTCFIRVELASNEKGVNFTKIPVAYFAENDSVDCGSWVSKSSVENAILDASSTSRTLATIGGVLVGAGVGFGAAEGIMMATDSLSGQRGLGARELVCSNIRWAIEHNNVKQDELMAGMNTCAPDNKWLSDSDASAKCDDFRKALLENKNDTKITGDVLAEGYKFYKESGGLCETKAAASDG